MAGPRLCALRIQNGTSNILLDNIESNISPVVYTRRTRLLDEELDETKDIITSPRSPNQTDQPLPFAGIPAGNKTDYEKCREVNPSESSLLRKDLLSGSSMSISTATNDRSPQLAPVILNMAKHRSDKAVHNTSDTTPSSRTANQSGTQSSSVSTSEPDIQESAILRRQQLTRVAEWVQNNHLDGVLIEGGRKSDGESVASLDSGYKTKVNNNLSQCEEDADELPSSTLPLSDDNKLNPAKGNKVLAQNLSNNNLIITDRTPRALAANSPIEAAAAPQIDFAQMEYNVKQFLLKQNEWSINVAAAPPHAAQTMASNNSATTTPHRTETNL